MAARAFLFMLGLTSLAVSNPIDTDPMQVVPACNLYYTVQNGDTCWDIISRNENTITMKQLLCWNPDVNPSCSNLIPGRYICIGVGTNGPAC
ncbi:hypothetical protein N7474_010753 [Penicillium riverlandense]|uniref:uncharacterized protein n=1 Tax=Penicillium riverlandense TaxID=1903569 RepID=UPI002546947E|nr:uncharacterized protein N7474_010753 [Penicillium riverlandense]KAJ5804866.1 hypothetical protein N7474_010753 [Penicillium riverlandense]